METTKKNTFLDSLLEGTPVVSSRARGVLEKLDFPTRKSEDWKYTRVGKIINNRWLQNPAGVVDQPIENLDSYLVEISNGNIVSIPSNLENGLTITKLTGDEKELNTLSNEGHIFSQINTGFSHAGIYVHVEKGTQVSKPIQFVQTIDTDGSIAQLRKLIVVESSASLTIVDNTTKKTEGKSFTNSVTEAFVHRNAQLTIDKLQNEVGDSNQVNSEYVYQEADSTFTINTVTLNGQLVRNGLNIVVDGTNCETNLNGLYLLRGNQHVDNHTLVDHKKPHCQSNELYKGIVDDSATGVFNGKVFVREDAQKIEAFQQNNNIVMTDRATMNSKPELEIYADDVKCSHGSTTGQFDEQAVFYLRARGIKETTARKLLVAAFAGDVLDKIENESVRSHIDKNLNQLFGWDF